jgi:hypothetical protein
MMISLFCTGPGEPSMSARQHSLRSFGGEQRAACGLGDSELEWLVRKPRRCHDLTGDRSVSAGAASQNRHDFG